MKNIFPLSAITVVLLLACKWFNRSLLASLSTSGAVQPKQIWLDWH